MHNNGGMSNGHRRQQRKEFPIANTGTLWERNEVELQPMHPCCYKQMIEKINK